MGEVLYSCIHAGPLGWGAACGEDYYFRDGDPFTEQIRQLAELEWIRDEIAYRLAHGELSDNDAGIHYKDWGRLRRVGQYAWDGLGAMTRGAAGSDPAQSFIGSFDLTWEVVGSDADGYVVEFHLTNASTAGSATTNPGTGKYPGDGTAGTGHDAFRGEHYQVQSFRWRETIAPLQTFAGPMDK